MEYCGMSVMAEIVKRVKKKVCMKCELDKIRVKNIAAKLE